MVNTSGILNNSGPKAARTSVIGQISARGQATNGSVNISLITGEPSTLPFLASVRPPLPPTIAPSPNPAKPFSNRGPTLR